jgi:ABC-2 type transport system ATP-binding protein
MIEASGLCKKFGDRAVLADLSFQIPDGAVATLLGPNGAGKSTLMGILAGCMSADSGTAVHSPGRLGYLPELPPLYDDMTVREYLLFAAGWKDIPSGLLASEVSRVMERFHLEEVMGRRLGLLSKGFRQRTGLAQTDLGQPPVILLDEPTAGLDPLQIKETREWILSLKGRSSVLVSTHILEEAAEISDMVLILKGGRVHPCGTTLDEIRKFFFDVYGEQVKN